MSEQTILLKEAVLKYFERLWQPGGSYANYYDAFPDVDVSPRDYLEFAENEIKQLDKGVEHFINCVSHLKRAIDSQIDMFFHIIGLQTVVKKRNLKFDKKLDLLREIEIVSPRTLSRLNHLRNKLEHEHKLPVEIDLELYLDLSTAFVSSIELTIALLSRSELEYKVSKDETGDEMQIGNTFNFKHSFPSPEIVVDWNIDGNQEVLTTKITPSSSESDVFEFAYFLKILILLLKFEGFGTSKFYIFEHV
jgi:hypothetical protein